MSLIAGMALVLGGCGKIRADNTGSGETSATKLGFKKYAGAVGYPSVTGPHNKG